MFEQRGFEVRFGWGPNGLRRLAPHVEAIVIIDVLSFSTSVDLILGRGGIVLPYEWHNGTEADYAAEHDAVVAAKTPKPGEWSLRPSSLVDVPAGLRIVLPSPNGSALTFGARNAGARRVIVGCLRNARAIARSLDDATSVGVIAAGERWRGATGPLRPALEDLLGAGAILSALGRSSMSPEATAAALTFESGEDRLDWLMRESGSGREHRAKLDPKNIELAADLNASPLVPTLIGNELIAG